MVRCEVGVMRPGGKQGCYVVAGARGRSLLAAGWLDAPPAAAPAGSLDRSRLERQQEAAERRWPRWLDLSRGPRRVTQVGGAKVHNFFFPRRTCNTVRLY
jgi:hypothetical protein